MGSYAAEQMAHPASGPILAHQEKSSARVKARLHKSIFFEKKGPNTTPVLVESRLHTVVEVHQDHEAETRLLAVARTYITIADGSLVTELVSTVHFSIFSGKPSHCFPGDDKARTKWLQEWHTARLTDPRLKDDGATREHVFAIRSLYKKDGALLDPGKKMLAGPHDSDTLIYISKIITEPKFAGKKLLKPMLDMLYKAVTHKNLSRRCKISGPVCWILEPGFINSEQNDEMWPKLDGEDEYARSDRVTRILKTKVYPKVGYTIYREDAKIPGQPDWAHTYMGRRVYAHPRPDGSSTCAIKPLPSEYPVPVPEPKASPTQNGKRERSDALSTSSEAHQTASASRSPLKKKSRSSATSFSISIGSQQGHPQSSHTGTSFTPINRPTQNSRASQRSQPRNHSGSSRGSISTASGARQAQSSLRNRAEPHRGSYRKRKASELDDDDDDFDAADNDDEDDDFVPGPSRARTAPRAVPKRSTGRKRKASKLDDENEEENEIKPQCDDNDEFDVDYDDDDDGDEDDFIPGPSLARTVRRPPGQPTEGARPTRSTYRLDCPIA